MEGEIQKGLALNVRHGISEIRDVVLCKVLVDDGLKTTEGYQ